MASQKKNFTIKDGFTSDSVERSSEVKYKIVIDTDTFYVDANNNFVGLGTLTPNAELHVVGGIRGTTFHGDGTALTGVAHSVSTLSDVDLTGLSQGQTIAYNANTQTFEPSNISGYTGSKGYTGSAGGAGTQGPIGYTGSAGAGYTGSQGSVGPLGYTGSRGAQGVQGTTGYTGSQGVTGYDGSIGGLGYTGSIGYTGSAGPTGPSGSQGPLGYTGSRGAQGVQGPTGYTGSKGNTGSTGAIGYTGSRGPQGITGYTGSKGSTGYTGSSPVTGASNGLQLVAGVISMTGTYTGDFSATGNITAYSSDARLKKDLEVIENAVDKLNQISGYTFYWDLEKCKKVGFTPNSPGPEHGVLAQEVINIAPDLVKQTAYNPEYLTVQYDRLISVVIQAVKELDARLRKLEN